MEIILASSSPRRQELLKLIIEEFKILSSDIEEITPEGMAPEKSPEYLAIKKAEEIAKNHPDILVIGCDTSVILDDHILGKPVDRNDAFRMLEILSGRTHQVITGCCLHLKGQCISFSEKTEVEFYPLSKEEINVYIETREPYDKAGAYGIQGKGAVLVKGINGDYYNVMGLPVAKLKREIQRIVDGEFVNCIYPD